MKPFENKQPVNLTPAQIRDSAWSKRALDYWKYEEGKRDHLPPSFEDFYLKNKNEFKNVLDVGGGTGRYAIPMAQDGLNVTLLEPSDGMRKEAEKNLEKAKLREKIQLVKGESKHLDFPDESFDFVFSKGTIHHNLWTDIEKSFAEISRVLKKDKFFLFQGRSISDSMKIRKQITDTVGYTAVDLEGNKKDVIQHYFTEEELKQLATKHGFKIVINPEEHSGNDSEKNRVRWWVVYKKI